MKKILSTAVVFAVVAFLGSVFVIAAPDEGGAEKATPKPCCAAEQAASCPDQSGTAAGPRCCAKPTETTTSETTLTDAKPVAAGPGKCGLCRGEDCKEQCTECASAAGDQTSQEVAAAVARGMGRGMGMGPGGMGHGHAGDPQHDRDHSVFFFLIDHKESITRTIKNLPNGIETVTESTDPDVAAKIQDHVEAMYDRMEHVNPIRMRDPLFREIFANAKKIQMEVEHTEQGVRVKETSDDAYVAKLLQKHAQVVSLFIKNGYSELPKNHDAPKR